MGQWSLSRPLGRLLLLLLLDHLPQWGRLDRLSLWGRSFPLDRLDRLHLLDPLDPWVQLDQYLLLGH